MNDKVNRLLAIREATLEREGREMWRTAMADTITDLLTDGASVNLYILREGIEAQITPTTNSYLRGQLLGARDILDELAARK